MHMFCGAHIFIGETICILWYKPNNMGAHLLIGGIMKGVKTLWALYSSVL